ncbi:NAD-dependent epimerase/dehydratase family protein [Robiginitalea sp. SC105]|uniref:NAD-dependent epimerase/dehydratase family protein n=1 Tax=Robiginitalea sp. SC105 TaxID=2762332 RepID=UPI00163B3F04|nr:NAD-dependent epimerase/dehydratase family protein [Robiginitalea sp. SC105]MBC2838496.1 NAD(P)H-binding protein [Robiginitalea sp. SC105]
MNRTIGVLGCGWLGLPLARQLLEAGYTVRGTTTDPKKLSLLQSEGIEAYQVMLKQEGFEGPWKEFFRGLDVLVFNIPPGIKANPETDYPSKVRYLLRLLEAQGPTRLIYIGSTSVYGRNQGAVDEATRPEPDSESGRQLLEAEALVLGSANASSPLIIRFGGLIGPDRHPVTMLSGRNGLSGGGDPVNLIERQDCINLILQAVSDTSQDGVVNAVAPGHPTKAAYYRREALKRGLPPPVYSDTRLNPNGKCIKSQRALVRSYHFLTIPGT